MNGRMVKVKDYVLDIFMPNRCPCCGGFLKWYEKLCSSCMESLPLCNEEDAPPKGCSASVSVFDFDGPAKQGIYSLKDGQGRAFAGYAAGLLAQRLDGCGADLITCVPMPYRKKSDRGWNQAEVIARELAKAMGVDCSSKILRRKYSRTEQHSLTAAGRAGFAEEQYTAAKAPPDIRGRRIILVDDVITTGATVSVCAAILLSLGAADVIAASVCRTKLRSKEK